jgi:uncharacterized protein YxeA
MEQQNNKSFLKWAMIGVLVLIFLIIGGYIYIRNRNASTATTSSTTDTTATTNTTTTDTTASASSILSQTDETASATFNGFETQGYAKAKIWNNAATLCAASVKISSDLSTQGMTYSYVYCAAADQTYYFNINFNSQSQFLRALIWQTDYIKAGLSPVSRTYLKISFFKALQTAETNGGQTFRSSHPQAAITLNLYKGDPSNYNYWFIKYEDPTTPDTLTIQIDANLGTIIQPSGAATNSNP